MEQIIDPSGIITSWHSYPKIYALGHTALAKLLEGPVLIEEKIDGSQFSFGRFNGALRVRSKGQEIFLNAPEKMFLKAIDYVSSIADRLVDGWTYRAEYLAAPKHNSLAYDRIPKNHLMVFDINTAEEKYMGWEEKRDEAAKIDLEVVPRIFEGPLASYEQFQTYLQYTSALGGQKVEGVVVKNYAQFGKDKKALMGKFVSEAFKEVHAAEWKMSNPGSTGIIDNLVLKYKTPARWQKAVQHLQEAGKLEGSPRDIGLILKEAGADILNECEEEIVGALKEWAIPKIRRGCTNGIAEWYKEQLAKAQFK